MRWWPIAIGLGVAAGCACAATTSAEPSGHRAIRLVAPVAQVLDGDTFDVDLNGDGRIEPPGERVRLLYVDTPELHDSPKGRDVAHGAPAKAALEAMLKAAPIELTTFDRNTQDPHGRTLASVVAGGVNVNLALIRQGHSYFDTRFTLPVDYDAFADAEGEAFDARRGIWSDTPSRKRYLERLRDEGKTPRSAKNTLYVQGVLPADGNAAAKWIGQYVTVVGTLSDLRRFGSGIYLLQIRQGSAPPLAVFASRSTAEKLPLSTWRRGQRLRAEGFMQRYKGRVEMRLHYAAPE